MLGKAGFSVGGADIRIESTVPLGSGLSSSAALEIALLRAFRDAFTLPLDDVQMARLGQRAENEFVGAPVGIMDQMACTLAGDGQALFLDTRSLDWTLVPLPADAELVVLNSGVAHNHAKGDYRTRRAECEEAARQLGVAQLRDIDVQDLPRVMQLDERLGRRARHVITEDARVVAAVAVMRSGDLDALGQLFYASHDSMRDDYEVSIPEIDLIVDLARAIPEVYGARLTGGGFGGFGRDAHPAGRVRIGRRTRRQRLRGQVREEADGAGAVNRPVACGLGPAAAQLSRVTGLRPQACVAPSFRLSPLDRLPAGWYDPPPWPETPAETTSKSRRRATCSPCIHGGRPVARTGAPGGHAPPGALVAPGLRRFARRCRDRGPPDAAAEAEFAPMPEGVDPRLVQALEARGIRELFTHQAAASAFAMRGEKNVVVTTPTASGKTLCYNLPVLNAILGPASARALPVPDQGACAGPARRTAATARPSTQLGEPRARRLHLRRRHAAGRAEGDPRPRARGADQPGHAALGHPAAPHRSGRSCSRTCATS